MENYEQQYNNEVLKISTHLGEDYAIRKYTEIIVEQNAKSMDMQVELLKEMKKLNKQLSEQKENKELPSKFDNLHQ